MEYPSLDKPKAGATRFNTDSSQLEIYDGNQWTAILSTSPELQTGGTRGLMAGGANPGYSDVIDYINISTTGDAIDFGNLLNAQYMLSGCASRTRGLFHGFQGSPNTRDNVIEYVTISTTGNAADFGDLTDGTREEGTGASNAVRGLFCGGSGPGNNNTTDYITMATLGNALDFGDLVNQTELGAAAASSTRVTVGGGTTPSKISVIDYFTIATTGDAVDFGDRTVTGYGAGSCSNGHGGL